MKSHTMCSRPRDVYLCPHLRYSFGAESQIRNPFSLNDQWGTIIIVLFVIRFNYLVTALVLLRLSSTRKSDSLTQPFVLTYFRSSHENLGWKQIRRCAYTCFPFSVFYFASFGLFAPYLERACLLLATPAVSSVPLTMWYLVPGRSLTLPQIGRASCRERV